MTQFAASTGSGRDSAIWALDLGAETARTATLDVDATANFNNQNFAVGVIQLSNADFSSITADAGTYASGPDGTSFTGLAADSIVIGTTAFNNNNGTGTASPAEDYAR